MQHRLQVIIIIKAICNAQDPLKKAANALGYRLRFYSHIICHLSAGVGPTSAYRQPFFRLKVH